MSASAATIPQDGVRWELPSRGRVAMYGLIAAESAIFTIFVVAYLFYVGKSQIGPRPEDVLHTPVLLTICLLSSSLTIQFAVKRLSAGKVRSFSLWWLASIVLGALFLGGTAREWHHLIYDEGLTLQRNLFGTTYYSLVGLHAFHVTVGMLALGVVSLFTLRGQVSRQHTERIEVLSMYWHFVDVVWVVVFTVVYVVGR